MHQFCPSCAKNGVESRIKAYQLNLEEAAFMCTSDSCQWPIGSQDVTYINRPVGEDWSKNWDEAAAKYFKSQLSESTKDPLSELSAYTPPQTPGTELASKDASVTNSAIQGSTIVPDKVFNSTPAIVDYIEPNIFDELDLILDYNFDEDIEDESCTILKPKLDFPKPIDCKLKTVPAQDHMFIKECDKTVVLDRKSVHQVNCENGRVTNKTTSLVSKIEVKNEKPSISKISSMKEGCRPSPRRLLKRKGEHISKFEKFDFNDLIKQKSTKLKQQQCKKEPIKIEICVKNPPQFNNKAIKMEKRNEVPQKNIKTLKVENYDRFDLDSLLSKASTNVNNIISNVELPNYNEEVTKSSTKEQIDFDSILGLTSSSKDSGVDHDITGNKSIDIDLDELLAGFSDDLSSTMSYNAQNYNSCKSPIEETDENKWINSLFE